jgi:hypothetical protein
MVAFPWAGAVRNQETSSDVMDCRVERPGAGRTKHCQLSSDFQNPMLPPEIFCSGPPVEPARLLSNIVRLLGR